MQKSINDMCAHGLFFRYAHCSVQRPDGEVIIYGGFGCSPNNGVHSRLNSMIGVTVSDLGIKIRSIEVCGDEENKPGNITLSLLAEHEVQMNTFTLHLNNIHSCLLRSLFTYCNSGISTFFAD